MTSVEGGGLDKTPSPEVGAEDIALLAKMKNFGLSEGDVSYLNDNPELLRSLVDHMRNTTQRHQENNALWELITPAQIYEAVQKIKDAGESPTYGRVEKMFEIPGGLSARMQSGSGSALVQEQRLAFQEAVYGLPFGETMAALATSQWNADNEKMRGAPPSDRECEMILSYLVKRNETIRSQMTAWSHIWSAKNAEKIPAIANEVADITDTIQEIKEQVQHSGWTDIAKTGLMALGTRAKKLDETVQELSSS